MQRDADTPSTFFENGLEHLVPLKHSEMDKWRDSLHQGLKARFGDTNIILTGGIDDIWQNTENSKLVIANYKSQANIKRFDPETYLSDPYYEGYKIQMDFYAYLLQQMGFDVEGTAYFMVCNADRQADGFAGQMRFSETLIFYHWNSDLIHGQVEEMIHLMNSNHMPDAHPSCKNCAYVKASLDFLSSNKTP